MFCGNADFLTNQLGFISVGFPPCQKIKTPFLANMMPCVGKDGIVTVVCNSLYMACALGAYDGPLFDSDRFQCAIPFSSPIRSSINVPSISVGRSLIGLGDMTMSRSAPHRM